MATRTSARRAGRLLWLGAITVVLVIALTGPAISAPWSAAGPDVAGDEAGQSNQWSTRPPLRQARGGLGVATVGRQILAIAGFDEGGFLDVVEARRVAGSGRWHDLAPLPTARANLATAAVGGLVYAIGGIDDVDTTNVVETFNPGWVAGRRVFPFPNHATGPEQRPWVGCSTWPVGSSSPTGSRTGGCL